MPDPSPAPALPAGVNIWDLLNVGGANVTNPQAAASAAAWAKSHDINDTVLAALRNPQSAFHIKLTQMYNRIKGLCPEAASSLTVTFFSKPSVNNSLTYGDYSGSTNSANINTVKLQEFLADKDQLSRDTGVQALLEDLITHEVDHLALQLPEMIAQQTGGPEYNSQVALANEVQCRMDAIEVLSDDGFGKEIVEDLESNNVSTTMPNWFNGAYTVAVNKTRAREAAYVQAKYGNSAEIKAADQNKGEFEQFNLPPTQCVLKYFKRPPTRFAPSLKDIGDNLDNNYNGLEGHADHYDPLILDLAGNGIHLTSSNDGIEFDLQNTGFAQQTAWIKPGEGFLVYDPSNGPITNGSQLFGVNYQLNNGSLATSGFRALADLDSNGDGVVNANDDHFNDLRILTSDGSLITLQQAGITQLNLQYQNTSSTDQYDNQQLDIGTFQTSDGSSHFMGDYGLVHDSQNSVATTVLTETTAVAALPDAEGGGVVYSLHQAMLRDTTGNLQSLIEQFTASTDPATQSSLLDQILTAWAGAPNGSTIQSGSGINLEHVYVVSNFSGSALSGVGSPLQSSYGPSYVEGAYQDYKESTWAQLMSQSQLSSYFNAISEGVDPDTGVYYFQLSGLTQALQQEIQTNYAQGKQDLANCYRAIVDLGYTDADDFSTFYSTFSSDPTLKLAMDTAGKTAFPTGTYADITHPNSYLNLNGAPSTVQTGIGDVVFFDKGDGNITVNETANLTVVLGSDVSSSDAYFESDDNGLSVILKFKDSSDSLHIGTSVQLRSGYAPFDATVQFADGTRLATNDILNNLSVYATANQNLSRTGDTISETLYANGNDSVYAGSGDTTLVGGTGTESLYAGSGNDTLVAGVGNTTLYGSSSGADTFVFNPGFGQATISDPSSKQDAVQFGTTLDDVRFSKSSNDLIATVVSTNDVLTIQNGMNTTSGAQYFSFADGNFLALTDLLSGAYIHNTIAANHTYVEPSNTAYTIDGQGNDTIFVNDGNNVVNGGGNATIVLGAGDNTVDAGPGVSTISGGIGNDTFLFDEGDGQQTISVNGGNDSVVFGAGITSSALQFAASGMDLVISFTSSSNDQIIIKGALSGDAATALKSVSFADESSFSWSQILAATTGYSQGSGNLTLNDGNNTVILGNGPTTIQSGAGSNTFVFKPGDGHVAINEPLTGSGVDTLFLGAGIDPAKVNFSTSGNDLIASVSGSTDQIALTGALTSQKQISTIQFANGASLSLSEILAQLGNPDAGYNHETIDQSSVSSDQYLVVSGSGDTIKLGSGNNVLIDKGGNSIITVGDGQSFISAGPGNSFINSGYGNDTISYQQGTGALTVNEPTVFAAGAKDTIEFGPGISPSALSLSSSGSSADIVISDGTAGDLLTITGALAGTKKTAAVFKFADGTQRSLSQLLANGVSIASAMNNAAIGRTFSSVNETITASGNNDVIQLGSGDDFVNSSGANTTIITGVGDNVVTVNHTGSDVITLHGYDTLTMSAGNDTVYGNGSDTFIVNAGGGTHTIIDSSQAADSIEFGTGLTQANLHLTGGQNPNDLAIRFTGSNDEVILSGVLNGTLPSDDVLFADGTDLSLSDLVQQYGVAVTDTIGGQIINHSSATWRENVSLVGGDQFYAGSGDDVITATGSNVVVNAGAGNDTVSLGSNETMHVGQGHADITTVGANDTIYGGTGSYTLHFGTGNGTETVYESYAGANGTDSVVFGSGITENDLILSSTGTALTIGLASSSDEVVLMGQLDTRPHYNVVSYQFADGTSVTADQLQSDIGIHVLSSTIDDQINRTFSHFNESIVSSGNHASIVAGSGNDLIAVSGDNDAVFTGTGIDTITVSGNNAQITSSATSGNAIINIDAGVQSVKISEAALSAPSTANTDTLVLAGSLNDVVLSGFSSQDPDPAALRLTDSVSGQQVLINNAFDNTRIIEFEFGDGTQMSMTQLLAAKGLNFNATNSSITIDQHNSTSNENITSSGANSTVLAGSGTNTIAVSGNNNFVQLGNGHDTASISGDNDSIRVVASTNTTQLTISGNNNTVESTQGSGTENITVGAGAHIITLNEDPLDAASPSTDTVTLPFSLDNAVLTARGYNLEISDSVSGQVITIVNALTSPLNIKPVNFVFYGSSTALSLSDLLTSTTIGNDTILDNYVIDRRNSSSSESIASSRNGAQILVGSGNDTVSISGTNDTVNLTQTHGNDTISIGADASYTIIQEGPQASGSSSVDELQLPGSLSDETVQLTDISGNDVLLTNTITGQQVLIENGAGTTTKPMTLLFEDSSSATLSSLISQAGTQLIELQSNKVLDHRLVTTSDYVSLTATNDSLYAGSGNATIVSSGASDSIRLGNGIASVTASGSNALIVSDTGNSSISVSGNNDLIESKSGSGNETIHIASNVEFVTISEDTQFGVSAHGNDTIYLSGTSANLNITSSTSPTSVHGQSFVTPLILTDTVTGQKIQLVSNAGDLTFTSTSNNVKPITFVFGDNSQLTLQQLLEQNGIDFSSTSPNDIINRHQSIYLDRITVQGDNSIIAPSDEGSTVTAEGDSDVVQLWDGSPSPGLDTIHLLGNNDVVITGTLASSINITGNNSAVQSYSANEQITIAPTASNTLIHEEVNFTGAGTDTIHLSGLLANLRVSTSTNWFHMPGAGLVPPPLVLTDTVTGQQVNISFEDTRYVKPMTFVFGDNTQMTLQELLATQEIYVTSTSTSDVVDRSSSTSNETIVLSGNSSRLLTGRGDDVISDSGNNNKIESMLNSGNSTIDVAAGVQQLTIVEDLQIGASVTPGTDNIVLHCNVTDLSLALLDGGSSLKIDNKVTGQSVTLINVFESEVKPVTFTFADGTTMTSSDLIHSIRSTYLVSGNGKVISAPSNNPNIDITAPGNNDLIALSTGNASLIANGINDTIYIINGDHNVVALGANDTFQLQYNTGGNETIITGPRAVLNDGLGNFVITGSGTFNLGLGNDTVNFNGDTTVNTGANPDTFNFGTGSGNDLINLYGSGSTNGNTVNLGPDLTIQNITASRQGNDLIIGISGTNDQLALHGQFAPTVSGPIDQFNLSNGATYTAQELLANAGRVDIVSTLDHDIVDGRAYSRGGSLTATGANDLIYAQGGTVVLNSSGANSVIHAGSGDDTISSRVGDTIYAGAGNDLITLVGTSSGQNTTLYGGAGTAEFDLGTGEGNITLYENTAATVSGSTDTLAFGPGVTALNLTATESGNDLVLTMTDGTVITLVDELSPTAVKPIETFTFSDGTSGALNDLIGWNITDDNVSLDRSTSAFFGTMNISGVNDSVLLGRVGSDVSASGEADSIQGGTGNESIHISGNDSAFTGNNGNDVIQASGDNATITAGSGSTTIIASGSNDAISTGQNTSAVTLNGTGDIATVTAGSNPTELTVNGDNATIYSQSGSGDERIILNSTAAGLTLNEGAQATWDALDTPFGTDTIVLPGLAENQQFSLNADNNWSLTVTDSSTGQQFVIENFWYSQTFPDYGFDPIKNIQFEFSDGTVKTLDQMLQSNGLTAIQTEDNSQLEGTPYATFGLNLFNYDTNATLVGDGEQYSAGGGNESITIEGDGDTVYAGWGQDEISATGSNAIIYNATNGTVTLGGVDDSVQVIWGGSTVNVYATGENATVVSEDSAQTSEIIHVAPTVSTFNLDESLQRGASGLSPTVHEDLIVISGLQEDQDLEYDADTQTLTVTDTVSGQQINILLGSSGLIGNKPIVFQFGDNSTATLSQMLGDQLSIGNGNSALSIDTDDHTETISAGYAQTTITVTGNNDAVTSGEGSGDEIINVSAGTSLFTLNENSQVQTGTYGTDTLELSSLAANQIISYASDATNHVVSLTDSVSGQVMQIESDGAFTAPSKPIQLQFGDATTMSLSDLIRANGVSITVGDDGILDESNSLANEQIEVSGQYASVYMGQGNTSVDVTGDGSYILTGTGNDTLTVSGNDAFIDTTIGSNALVSISGNDAFVFAGAGAQITVTGDDATIQETSWLDSVVNIGGNTDVVNAFTGHQTVNVLSSATAVEINLGFVQAEAPVSSATVVLPGLAENEHLTYTAAPSNYDHSTLTITDSSTGQVVTIYDALRAASNPLFFKFSDGSTESVLDFVNTNGIDYTVGDNETVDHSSSHFTENVDITGSNSSFTAGHGNSNVSITGNNDFVHLGAGQETVFVSGTADSIKLGSGAAQVEFSSNANLYSSNGTSILQGTGSFAVANDGASLGLSADSVNIVDYAANETITGGSGTEVISSVGDNSTFTGTSGTDTITAYGSHLSLAAGSGNTTVYSNGDHSTFTGGTGSFTVYASGSNDVFTAGSGDTFFAGGGNHSVFTAGSGNDQLWASGNDATLIGGSGNYTIYDYGVNATLIGGSGTGSIGLAGGATNSTFTATDGTDSIVIDASYVTVTGGSGHTTVGSDGNNNTFIGAAGTFTVNASGNDNVVTAGDGDTYFNDGGNNDVFTAGAGNVWVNGGTNALITGGSGNDTMTAWGTNSTIIGGSGTEYIGFAYSASNSTFTGTTGADSIAIDANDVIVTAGSGDTTVTHSYGNNGTFAGGSGSFTVNASGSNDIFTGGSGNDNVTLWGGNATIIGGSGTESIYFAGDNTIFTGTSGTDSITDNGNNSTITAGSGSTTVSSSGNGVMLIGTTAAFSVNTSGDNNVFTAGSGDTNFIGSGNNDVFTLGAGNDSVTASGNNDLINGGSGIDNVTAWGANATIVGGSGTESIAFVYSASNSSFTGTTGNDSIIIDANDVIVTAGSGDTNVIRSGGNSNTFVGSTGSFTVNASGNSDTFTAGSGDTSFNGSGNDDVFTAGSGNLTLNASGNNAYITGGSGNDSLTAWGTNATIVGGSGTESIAFVYSASNSSFTGTSGTDSIVIDATDIIVTAGSGATTVTARGANNKITGGEGLMTVVATANNASITGGSGNDNMTVWGGNATIIGGSGTESIYFAGDNITFTGTSGTDTITDNGNNSTITAGSGSTTVSSSGNDVTLIGSTAAFSVNTSGNNNVFTAGSGDTDFTGSGANDVFTLDAGTDSVTASGDNASITGGSGNDTMTIWGGNAAVTGGSGTESISFETGSDNSTFTGTNGTDSITVLSDNAVINSGSGTTTVSSSGSNTLFGVDHGTVSINDTGDNGTVLFGSGISNSDIALFMDGNDLEFGYVGNNADLITIENQNSLTPGIQSFQLSDGEYMSSADVNLLIQQMTTYAADNDITLNNISDVKSNSDLMNLISNSWHAA